LLGGLLSLAIFYYVSRLVRVKELGSHDEYFAYVVIGLVILQVLNSSFSTLPVALRGELVTGTFERLVLSPLGPISALVATTAVPFAVGLLSGTCMLAVGAAAFGLDVEWSSAWLLLPLVTLAWAALAPLGLMVTGFVILFKRASSALTWIVAALSLVGGLYFPVGILPGGIRWASEVQPLTPAVDLMRHALVGTPLADPAWVEVAKLAAFAAVLMPISLWALRFAVQAARRRGTILEY
jgi:ABC-type multidrug transport system permease subunit